MRARSPNHIRYLFAGCLILALAAGLRLWELGLKPPHFDEGINGYFVDRMTMDGGYIYDPNNYHGPLYFYVLLLFKTILGHSIEVLRLPTALAGIGIVAVALWGFRRHIGNSAALWLGAFLSISPALVFVSRYAIHETFLLLFLMLTCLGLMDHWSGRRGAWLICLGTAGMVLTKETYMLHLMCLALAWVVWSVLRRWSPDTETAGISNSRPDGWKGFITPAVTSGALVLFFYSETLLKPAVITGLWRTFATWTETGLQTSGHAKAPTYWLGLMTRYEWVALVGIAASIRFILPATKVQRILVIAGVGTLTAYSIIPYKTPWCIIMLLWSGSFTLALLLAELSKRGRAWLLVATLAGGGLAGHDLWKTVALNWQHYDDSAEPYVYVQTSREITRFTGPLRQAERRDPTFSRYPGAIVVDAPFPLPWMLEDFSEISYLGKSDKASRNVTLADFILTEASRQDEVEAALYGTFYMTDLTLRDGKEPMVAYFREHIFEGIIPETTPTRSFLPQPPTSKPEENR